MTEVEVYEKPVASLQVAYWLLDRWLREKNEPSYEVNVSKENDTYYIQAHLIVDWPEVLKNKVVIPLTKTLFQHLCAKDVLRKRHRHYPHLYSASIPWKEKAAIQARYGDEIYELAEEALRTGKSLSEVSSDPGPTL